MDEIKQLKEKEQANWIEDSESWPGEAVKKETRAQDGGPPNFPMRRLGVFLILIGLIALFGFQFEDGSVRFGSIWQFWWLIFFIKPLLFGFWGRNGRFSHSC